MGNAATGLLFDLLDDLGNFLRRHRWRGWTLEESSKLLALLLGVGRIPRVVGRLAEKEVRHEDLVLVLLVGVC